MLIHEEAYRGEALMLKIASSPLVVCGAGAVGSNLTETLVRQGFRDITVIDNDKVEAGNLGTQSYDIGDIGAPKVLALRNRCSRIAKIYPETVGKRITSAAEAARVFKGASLVVDSFDNSASRAIVTEAAAKAKVECLHIGLNTDYAELCWNSNYRVPADVVDEDVCDYPLARNLVTLAVSVGAEMILRFLGSGVRAPSLTITLKDFRILPDPLR